MRHFTSELFESKYIHTTTKGSTQCSLAPQCDMPGVKAWHQPLPPEAILVTDKGISRTLGYNLTVGTKEIIKSFSI